jgi:hypothetical protein
MLPSFVMHLRDVEAEVRIAAASKSITFAAKIPADAALTQLLPCFRELANDSSQHARCDLTRFEGLGQVPSLTPLLGPSCSAACASVIMGLSPIVGVRIHDRATRSISGRLHC